MFFFNVDFISEKHDNYCMKILIVTARYYPEQFSITNIAETFVKNGHDVTVITGKPNYGYGKILPEYKKVKFETINGVKVHRVKEIARKKSTISLIISYFSLYFGIKKTARKLGGDYDVLLSHVLSPILTARAILKFAKKHDIPHIHYGLDLWPESLIATNTTKRKSLLYKMVYKLSKKTYEKMDMITFSSPSAIDYFENVLKIDKNIPVRVVYQPYLSKSAIIEDPVFNEDHTEILYCGTVAKFHYLHLLIDAMKLLKDEKIHLTIVGSGSELERIKAMVQEYNLSERVSLVGRVSIEETVEYYKKADVLYLPLINNSRTSLLIPQKVLEYLKMSKPIIGMLQGDGKKILEDAGGSIFVDENPESIKEGILKVAKMTNEEKRAMGLKNSVYFKERKDFDLDNICEVLLEDMIDTIEIHKKKK